MRKPLVQICAVLCLAASGQAQADFSLSLDTEFSGATASSGPILATFEDLAANTVRLTIDTSGFTGGDFITGFYFNYASGALGVPAINTLSITHVPGVTGTATPGSIDKSGTFVNLSNCTSGGSCSDFKADGDGYFDFVFNYPSSGVRFTDEKKSAFDIVGTGLTSSMFEVGSVGGAKGSFYAAAHVQGIGPGAALSGWMGASTVTTPIPEPETYAMLLAGLALIGVVGARRRRARNTTGGV